MPDIAPIIDAAKIAYTALKPQVMEEGQKLLGSMRGFLSNSESGKMLLDIHLNDYLPAYHQAIQAGVETATKTGSTTPHAEIISQAANTARRAAFGHNDAIAAGVVAAAHKEGGSLHAQAVGDHIAMLYRDNTEQAMFRDKSAARYNKKTKTNVSSIKTNIANNKLMHGKNNPIVKSGFQLNTAPVFKPAGPIEKSTDSFMHVTALPFVAWNHIAAVGSLSMDTAPSALIKGMQDVMGPANYQNTQRMLKDSGVLADTVFNTYKDLQEYKTGTLAKITTPNVAYAINKAIHQPGLNTVREWSITYAGAVAKHVLQDAAAGVMQNNLKSIETLKRMGIDPNEVWQMRGQINQEHLNKAVFRFVDDHIFIDRRIDRSYYAQSNWMFRAATMYHGFHVAQASFIYRGLKDAFKSKETARIAQFVGALTVAAPVFGELIHIGGDYLRGDINAGNKDFKNATGQNGGEAAGEAALMSLAYYAGFGIWTSYAHKANTMQLAASLLGPKMSMATQLAQDSVNATTHLDRSQPKKQVLRDVLSDSLPFNAGKLISHQFLKTNREEKEADNRIKRIRIKHKLD